MRICSTCKVEKEDECFNKNRSSKDGLQPSCRSCQADYRTKNKEKIRQYSSRNAERSAEYRRNNRDYLLQKGREFYARNAEAQRARSAAYRLENIHKVRAKHAEHYANNLAYYRAAAAKRRAAKSRATPAWSDNKSVAEFYFAADFLGMVTGEWYHVDHIVPLQGKIVCGLHCEQNLQVLPGRENLRKLNSSWPDMP